MFSLRFVYIPVFLNDCLERNNRLLHLHFARSKNDTPQDLKKEKRRENKIENRYLRSCISTLQDPKMIQPIPAELRLQNAKCKIQSAKLVNFKISILSPLYVQ